VPEHWSNEISGSGSRGGVFAPKGQQNLAQGFNPGLALEEGYALTRGVRNEAGLKPHLCRSSPRSSASPPQRYYEFG
jgi:hypothetical protein